MEPRQTVSLIPISDKKLIWASRSEAPLSAGSANSKAMCWTDFRPAQFENLSHRTSLIGLSFQVTELGRFNGV